MSAHRFVLAAINLVACLGGAVQAQPSAGGHEILISAKEYGAIWPFTVESGILAVKTTMEVTFTTGGKTYYVNGRAKSTGRYSELEEIWADQDDPNMPKGLGLKKSMGPIIDRGLKLAKGINEPFISPNASPSPVPDNSSSIRCDKFELTAAFEQIETGNTRRIKITVNTDLPDSTKVMVSVDRSFFNSADNEEYAIAYFDDKSTVGEWRTGRVVELDQGKWQSKLDEKRDIFRKTNEKFTLTRLEDSITVDFVVPTNQSDKRFGLQNANLVGNAVQDSDGRRVVRGEAKLKWPVTVH